MQNESQIKVLLNEQKFRLTNERHLLLKLFSESSRMLTPAQLHELALEHQVKIGLTTVYRLLEVLTKTELATPFLIEGVIYYTFCGCNHHHHLVCLSCHQVLETHQSCPTVEVPEDFRVEHHRLDLYGKCSACQHSIEGGESH
ncbi:transcriptional repressor [Pullulanibacillus sp. KACC 23026]|uniref:Fur family transcriptional regulator n=1 Tax=Pullulanibacillus sp. KACC 23026 TaxID=3028315 RepID=UPI0023B02B78|nr:transcriptional repressor [Pullulanibacillus sp. KACC 23026]WEG10973.1 transcriptional repressor [Pullulanibacillus sp. KACC 23026]